MKNYVNIEGFWLNGVYVDPLTPLTLNEGESKYIRHNLVEVTDEVPAGVVVEGEAEVETVSEEVTEEVEDKPRRARK